MPTTMDRWPYAVYTMSKWAIEMYCVRDVCDRGWQNLRRSLKGVPTNLKLQMLMHWRKQHLDPNTGYLPIDVRVQIDNYLNALKRGGFLDADLNVRK